MHKTQVQLDLDRQGTTEGYTMSKYVCVTITMWLIKVSTVSRTQSKWCIIASAHSIQYYFKYRFVVNLNLIIYIQVFRFDCEKYFGPKDTNVYMCKYISNQTYKFACSAIKSNLRVCTQSLINLINNFWMLCMSKNWLRLHHLNKWEPSVQTHDVARS